MSDFYLVWCVLDEVYTLDSNELSEEIATLQQRAMDLATELAQA